jgi:RNA polymerase subunit RPABC4/transcription elongation factor Spt4
MQWRCTECGRPHESRPDVCECGASTFERGVVKLTEECTTCGEAVPEEANTCPECGFTSFEPLGDPDVPDEADKGYVEWQCTDCGKSHPKHTPPCDRCGNLDLEQTYVDNESVDPNDFLREEPWWKLEVDRVTLMGVSLVLGVFVLFGTGVAGVGPAAGLVAPDVNESVVESNLVAELDDATATGGLERDGSLDEVAAEATRRSVAGEERGSADERFDGAGYDCADAFAVVYSYEADPLASPNEGRLARAFAERILSVPDDQQALSDADVLGVDARQNHREIVVGVAAC